MQRAAEDPYSTTGGTWPFTLACTTPRAKVNGSWPQSPTAGTPVVFCRYTRG